MSEYDIEFEEEEFSGKVSAGTLRRILAQALPYRAWVIGFLVCVAIVSILDAYFTYLSLQIVDLGITPGNRQALVGIAQTYAALIFVQAASVFLSLIHI